MKSISVNTNYALGKMPEALVDAVQEEVVRGYRTLCSRSGEGNDFLGWVGLPHEIDNGMISAIMKDAQYLQKKSDVVVIVGIGGSYLGARAVINAILPEKAKVKTEVVFAGHNLNAVYHNNLIKKLNDVDYSIVVISKSGTTTEPAVAFRILKQHIINKYGESEAANRIIAITDKQKGTLKEMANLNGYRTYVIPDNVGGRFSVFTPVGLLPMAIAGVDIRKIISGARIMESDCASEYTFLNSPTFKYCLARNVLYAAGYDIEVLVNYLDHLNYVSEWWKQLFGESEGKDGKGIFPASVSYTTDLHSLGQFVQGGTKKLFETVLQINRVSNDVEIPFIEDDMDNLNYIAGKSMHQVNKVAQKATMMAHVEGGVPNILITMPQINEVIIGQLLYMMEFACGVSGYTIGVNPFDQPDVEAYKKKMFELLGKNQ